LYEVLNSDFVFWMHFIKPVYVVGSFDLAIALLLIAVTAVLGFVAAFGRSLGRTRTAFPRGRGTRPAPSVQ
jgi:hypothetical protein